MKTTQEQRETMRKVVKELISYIDEGVEALDLTTKTLYAIVKDKDKIIRLVKHIQQREQDND